MLPHTLPTSQHTPSAIGYPEIAAGVEASVDGSTDDGVSRRQQGQIVAPAVNDLLMASLVCQAQSGDSIAFGSLCNALRPVLLRYFAKHDLESAMDDMTQEVLVRLARSLARVESARAMRWIWRIATNVARNEYRRRRREARIFQSCDGDQDAAVPGRCNPQSLTESDWAADAAIGLSDVWTICRRELSADQLDTLRLCVSGYTREEIATLTHVDCVTVRTRLHRARCKLKTALALESGGRSSSAA